MAESSEHPVDFARTTRKHAGETVKNTANAPGLIAMAVAVVSFVVGLFAFATGHAIVGTAAMVVAVLLASGGGWWLARAHRRVRQAEERFLAEHPEVPSEPPTS
jgi:protein-S-isoprenylcysteine O-methyltransferase Ste14